MLHISFLMFSLCLGVLLHIASPSSLYSPMFILNCSSWGSLDRQMNYMLFSIRSTQQSQCLRVYLGFSADVNTQMNWASDKVR